MCVREVEGGRMETQTWAIVIFPEFALEQRAIIDRFAPFMIPLRRPSPRISHWSSHLRQRFFAMTC